MKNKLYLLLPFLFCGMINQAQTNEKKQIATVFNQLVLAYGNAKSAPQLIILDEKIIQKTPAFYSTSIKPTINIDFHFYKLCQTFGKDSLNALSIVLSHELAHYYNDHTFCSDFAFAISKNNLDYAEKLKVVSTSEKMSLETQADYKGLFYSTIAGYSPFEIQPHLLDAIYTTYNLKDENIGYPSKSERKQISQNALKKASDLYLVFQSGLQAKEAKKFDEAITAFEEVNNYFPSRENYNNLGVVKTLKALEFKVLTSEEFNFPKRFQYPLEIDNSSRLQQSNTRSVNSSQENMLSLLKSAQKDFEKAISLDVDYSISYINLACVFDLLENPEAAIGKIKELPADLQNEVSAQQILAIAYYHSENEQKAEGIWKLLKM